MLRLNQAGATLMELLISMTISSIVMVALVGVTSMHISQVNRSNARSGLAIDVMLLSDYFAKEIPSAGGELLPIWSALIVENNCDSRDHFPNCARSDRLSVINTMGSQACSIRASSNPMGRLFIDNVASPCCLDTMDLIGTQVVLTNAANVGQRYITAVDKVACTVDVVRGPVAFNDTAAEPLDWTGALMIPVQIKTYFLDRQTNELNRFTYRAGGTSKDDGQLSPVADRVMDFQVALGFDFNPVDGIIRDTGNDLDEFLYNDPTGGEKLGVGALKDASMRQLRMVAVGLMLAMPSQTPNSFGGQTLLDGGPLAPGNWTIERQTSTYMLRSTRSYQ